MPPGAGRSADTRIGPPARPAPLRFPPGSRGPRCRALLLSPLVHAPCTRGHRRLAAPSHPLPGVAAAAASPPRTVAAPLLRLTSAHHTLGVSPRRAARTCSKVRVGKLNFHVGKAIGMPYGSNFVVEGGVHCTPTACAPNARSSALVGNLPPARPPTPPAATVWRSAQPGAVQCARARRASQLAGCAALVSRAPCLPVAACGCRGTEAHQQGDQGGGGVQGQPVGERAGQPLPQR